MRLLNMLGSYVQQQRYNMDIKQLLEKMDQFAGEKVGQKPGDQWRGTDKAPPGKKLVGDSILKDLSKGKTPKSKEQELSEEFQAFLEAEFKDTVDKRPGRKSDRPSRGHEPKPRYKTIKADESYMSEKDIELQDYRSMTNQEFQTAYGMSKMEWINQNKALVIQNPDLKRALGLEEAVGQEYTVIIDRKGRERPVTGTIPELLDYFGYTLEVGKSYEHERGRYKINMNPKNIQSLVDNLNKAASNGAANSAPSTYYSVGESQVAEGVPYKATNPHPASKDPIVAKVLKQMRPGLTGLEMNNEAFLYFAYEIGKMRAREMWEDYGPAIKHFYQSGIGVNELDEAYGMGPKPYKGWTYDVWEDDDGDVRKKFHSAKKDGQEVDMDWSPYDTPQDKDWQLWIDLGMPTREQLGLRGPMRSEDLLKLAQTKQGTHSLLMKEGTDSDIVQPMGQDAFNRGGHNPIRDERDYLDKLRDLSNLSRKPGLDQSMKAEIFQRINDLNAEARKKGYIQAESRGHKIIATKLKDIEREKKFASGELKIPTPQERQAQLKRLEKDKPVKEFVATPAQGTANQTMQQKTQAQDPKQAQAVQQAVNTLKSATQSTAPTTNIAKALDSASQGKPVGQQDMKALEPLMKDVATIAQTPQLAGQLKTVLSQVQQVQQKQKQQTT